MRVAAALLGFAAAALLLIVIRFIIRNPALFAEPKGSQPPPWWVRGVLILTCTSVSFAHGSNDGQKGMGLIMMRPGNKVVRSCIGGLVRRRLAVSRPKKSGRMSEFAPRLRNR